MVQWWLRIHLPMKGTQVQSLAQEDEEQLSLCTLEPVLPSKSRHLDEKPEVCYEEYPPLEATRESPRAA